MVIGELIMLISNSFAKHIQPVDSNLQITCEGIIVPTYDQHVASDTVKQPL